MKEGDYVLATKYSDGDPMDHFVVGYYTHEHPKGWHHIIDGDGKLFRGNGFRRVKKITAEQGHLMVHFMKDIERGDRSVWGYLRRWRDMKKWLEEEE